MGGTRIMNEERYQKLLNARGNRPVEFFARAVKELQGEGFKTELWAIGDGLMLRWVKGGARWHIEVKRAVGKRAEVLNSLGRNAINWMNARRNGSANETSYAIMER